MRESSTLLSLRHNYWHLVLDAWGPDVPDKRDSCGAHPTDQGIGMAMSKTSFCCP